MSNAMTIREVAPGWFVLYDPRMLRVGDFASRAAAERHAQRLGWAVKP